MYMDVLLCSHVCVCGVCLQECEKELGIVDVQLGLTPMEEVFISVVRRADAGPL